MRKLLPILALAFSIVLAACDGTGGGPTEVQDNVSGTYTLQTVNAAGVPAVIFQNSAGRVELSGGTMVLRPDRSYTETWQLRVVYSTGGTETDQNIENGSYSVTGTTITFTVPPANGESSFSYTGAISGRDLTYTTEGVALKYRRQ